jgi:hypothetical protein
MFIPCDDALIFFFNCYIYMAQHVWFADVLSYSLEQKLRFNGG